MSWEELLMTSKLKHELNSTVCALAWAAVLAGCTSGSEGVRLDVAVSVHASELTVTGKGTPRHGGTVHVDPFLNDEGYTVDIDRAYIVIEEIELVACESTAAADLLKLFSPVQAAHAHTTSTPTKSGVPVVVDASEAIEAAGTVGELSPPPDTYCSVKVKIGPADGDAVDLPESPNMVGKSLYLEGTYEDEGTVAYTIQSSDTLTITVPFLNADGDPTPLDLTEVGLHEVTLGATYDTWLDGVDFGAQTAGQMAAAALASVAASIVHEVQ